MQPPPLYLPQVQLAQCILGVLPPGALPVLCKAGQCQAHEGGQQGDTHHGFDERESVGVQMVA